MNLLRVTAVIAAFCLAPLPALADEGMWPFDNVPVDAVRQSLGVTLDKPLLDHLQASTLRLPNTGCSASIVSGEGLVLTNEHCVLECAQALSDGEHDYMQDGFLTASRAEERACPGLEAQVLLAITDVTAKAKAVPAHQREALLASLEAQACKAPGPYKCHAVSLYRGGQFKIYRYRRYTDVRLVFAPEYAAFFFGGDPDNFNFPRFAFDAAFLRLYEEGKAARTPDHLTFTARAPVDGEPTFLVGNPGTTERLLTVSQLETVRDVALPLDQLQRAELRGRLMEFSRRQEANRRAAAKAIFTLENAFKVYSGRQQALDDPRFMAAKRAEEAQLRGRVAADAALTARIGDPWADMAKAQGAYAERYAPYRQLEEQAGRGSVLYGYARTLVRAAQERTKPAADRIPEYADSRLPGEERKLLTAKPIEPGLEQIHLEHWLLKTRELLTSSSPAVQTMLRGESPEGLARRLAQGTRLADPAYRKKLWDGGLAAVEASDDPMIAFVLATDPAARGERELWRREVTGPTEDAAERIAQARFAVFGDSVYPDATFTPRLSFGKVAGWTWRGPVVTPFTTIGGLYERATGIDPYVLAPRWAQARGALNPATVLNFATTNDVIGGSSGSPVVDGRGELIGVVFDSNIHGLGGAYGYDPELNRALVVSTAAIAEGLDKVYGRTALVRELTGR
jgi:hypothetical protein